MYCFGATKWTDRQIESKKTEATRVPCEQRNPNNSSFLEKLAQQMVDGFNNLRSE